MRLGSLLSLIGLTAGSAATAASLPAANFNFSRNDSVLVVSPHPDDETLCCAGVMQRALAQGARVSVVWVTGGDAFELDARLVEHRLRPGTLGLRKLGDLRVGEAMAAAERTASCSAIPTAACSG
jgi:LmbE family N-acetylglucosaminyl deacetylase